MDRHRPGAGLRWWASPGAGVGRSKWVTSGCRTRAAPGHGRPASRVTAPPGRAVRQAVPCGKGNPRAPVAGESAVWGITARPAAVPHNASRHGPAVPHNDSGRGPAVPQNAPATEPRAARRSAAMASPS
ncbi:hypothetical protein TBS_15380 [Thermobispora bispora]